MKAVFENIPAKTGSCSVYSTYLSVPAFEFKWHYHPEYELTFILKGEGYRMVGNSLSPFTSNDLVLLGSNLPHTWCGRINNNIPSEAIVIQFSENLINPFLKLDEFSNISSMLSKSALGIYFEKDEFLEIKLQELPNLEGVNRIISLLSILNHLSCKSFQFLSNKSHPKAISKRFESRINKVCLYIQNNFSESIKLHQIADMIHMTESNFCKFFKKATSMTFTDYLNNIRINEVCHLLITTEDSIGQIAQECGFESLSYFNRVFASKIGTTPSYFRKQNLL